MDSFRSSCERCGRFIVWQNEGVWFCWHCDPSNTTKWRYKTISEPAVAAFEIEDGFVYVETKRSGNSGSGSGSNSCNSKQKSHSSGGNNSSSSSSNNSSNRSGGCNGDIGSESKEAVDSKESELRNRVLGSLVGFMISEAIGVAAKEGPAALQTDGVEAQPGANQLLMALDCLIGTEEDSSLAQEDFAKRLAANADAHCALARKVVDHPDFLEKPEKASRAIWDTKVEPQEDSNTALARAIAAGVFFQGDHETASEAAKALTTVTHNDLRSRHNGAASALSASIAMLLARPQADAYAVATEAFEFAAASLHEDEQEDEIYELHRHLFPADLEDLELADLKYAPGVLKAAGSGFYCLTSNRIQNPLSKEDAEHAGALSAAEQKHWRTVDDEELMSTPLVLNAALAGFGDALQAQMKEMEARLLALAGGPLGGLAKSPLSDLPAFKPRPSAESRQAAFQEQITMLALEGGCSEVNCAVAGALMGAHFGFDGLPSQWVQGLGERVTPLFARWESLRGLIIRD